MKPRLYFTFPIIIFLSCFSEPKIKVDINEKYIDENIDTISNSSIKIGVAAMLSPKEALPAYEEIVKYIGQQLNLDFEMLFTKDYATMNDLVKNKKVMAAFVCSGPYVKEHDEWGMELLAVPSLHGNPYYYSYIISNKESKINTFNDLRNKSFAFTDPESNTGKLVPTYELKKKGELPDKYFSKYIYTGSHDKSIEAVANNLVDGAAVDHLIWEYLNRLDSNVTSKTKIIAKFGPFCAPPFVTYPDCDIMLKNEMRQILFNMNNDPNGKKILDKLFIDKFVDVDDDCYSTVRDMQEWIDIQ